MKTIQTFTLREAIDAAAFLADALHDFRNRKGISSEVAAQNILYGYLAGRAGADRVLREQTGRWRGKIDFVVRGSVRTSAIELVVRQPHTQVGTGARTYVLPRTEHISDNVRKLLHFQGARGQLTNAFLIIVDRNARLNALVPRDVVYEYRQRSWAWRGPRQAWHGNSFRLVFATAEAEPVQALISSSAQRGDFRL